MLALAGLLRSVVVEQNGSFAEFHAVDAAGRAVASFVAVASSFVDVAVVVVVEMQPVVKMHSAYHLLVVLCRHFQMVVVG